MKIEFRDIKGFEGLYMVSNNGQVMSLVGKEPKLLSNILSSDGKYYTIGLSKNGVRKRYGIHRLVAEAFIPNPMGLSQINHKDENGLNNTVENLEWCDRKYNMNYGTRKQRHDDQIKKAVLQFDIEGNFIKEWKGASDAEAFYNRREMNNITKCCNGRTKTAYGFKWRYKKSEQEKYPNSDSDKSKYMF